MRYRELGQEGKPGLRVSEIGLSTSTIGGTIWVGENEVQSPRGYGLSDDEMSAKSIKAARDSGFNFLFTDPLDGAGHGQEFLGQQISDDRDYWVITTLGGSEIKDDRIIKDFSYETLASGLDRSIDRLKSIDVDLFLLDNPSRSDIASGECIDALNKIESTGKTAFVGIDISQSDVTLEEAVSTQVDIVSIKHNLLYPNQAEAFAKARAAGVNIIARDIHAQKFFAEPTEMLSDFSPEDERSNLRPEQVEHLVDLRSQFSRLGTRKRSLAQSALMYVLANRAVSVAVVDASSVDLINQFASIESKDYLSDNDLLRIQRVQRDLA
tara:strand:- start:3904 stop:4875 length:972 start_codon:yes stop_codon:yes gene_type:complete